jgi:hypothetical protein
MTEAATGDTGLEARPADVESTERVKPTHPFQRDERLVRVHEEHAVKMAQIEAQAEDLKPEVVLRLKSQLSQETTEKVKAIREARRQEERQLADEAEQRLFQPPLPKDAVTENQRRAVKERTFRAYVDLVGKSEAELKDIMDAADRLGLSEYSHAAWMVGLQRDSGPLRKQFLESHPDMQPRWQEYLQARGGPDLLSQLFTGIEEQPPGS